jgi:hypothetical protein
LLTFGKCTNNIKFLVGDNCSTNKKLSNDISVPLVGCASHRLSLAVNVFLNDYEEVISKIDQLMSYLKTNKGAANLRKATPLIAVKQQKTRWSSTFEMLQR